MNVSDIIDRMNLLAIGGTNQSDLDKDIALKYLNLAHEELYRDTATFNVDAIDDQDVTLDTTYGASSFELRYPPHSLASVRIRGRTDKLTILPKMDFLECKFLTPDAGSPQVCTLDHDEISIWPVQAGTTYDMYVIYIFPWNELAYNDQESDIPYPKLFHSVLMYGGLQYLYDDEAGFRTAEKVKKTDKKWEDGKKSLSSYFYNASVQRIGTYSNL